MKKLILLSIMATLAFSAFTSTASAGWKYKYSPWSTVYTYKCSGCTKAAAIQLRVKIKYYKVRSVPPRYNFYLYGKMRPVRGYSNPYVYYRTGYLGKYSSNYLLYPASNWYGAYVKGETNWQYLGRRTNFTAYSWNRMYGKFYADWSYGSRDPWPKTRGVTARLW